MSAHAIHHVTAVTAKIGENLRFYTQVLGLRLVKRSVNQDDVKAYHLFYADARGTPGTDMTFFDWPAIGPSTPGYASIARTRFRIPTGSIDFWVSRLESEGLIVQRVNLADRASFQFSDPEGQHLELIEDSGWPTSAQPWDASVPGEQAIRGILGVDLASARPDSTRQVLKEVLGYEETSTDIFETLGPDAIAQVRLVPPPEPKMARLGAGGVHHVAFRIDDDDEMHRMQEKIESLGLHTSGFVDRYYFHSLYFREPGGILFELATDGPGFGADEDMSTLGSRLALPPFLEPRRAQIEAGLEPLPNAL